MFMTFKTWVETLSQGGVVEKEPLNQIIDDYIKRGVTAFNKLPLPGKGTKGTELPPDKEEQFGK